VFAFNVWVVDHVNIIVIDERTLMGIEIYTHGYCDDRDDEESAAPIYAGGFGETGYGIHYSIFLKVFTRVTPS
jgi:hypothetical protein